MFKLGRRKNKENEMKRTDGQLRFVGLMLKVISLFDLFLSLHEPLESDTAVAKQAD